jgi:hypothetical protein
MRNDVSRSTRKLLLLTLALLLQLLEGHLPDLGSLEASQRASLAGSITIPSPSTESLSFITLLYSKPFGDVFRYGYEPLLRDLDLEGL